MAKNDLAELAVVMNRTAEAFVADATEYQNELITHFVAEVARNTPVDTGKAKSNWVVSLGSAFGGIRAAFSPFLSRYKGGAGGSTAETRNQAGVTWSAASVLAGNKDGQDVYITNNLPYIQRLNEGWSKQAPAGFVEAAIVEATTRTEAEFSFPNMEKVFGNAKR